MLAPEAQFLKLLVILEIFTKTSMVHLRKMKLYSLIATLPQNFIWETQIGRNVSDYHIVHLCIILNCFNNVKWNHIHDTRFNIQHFTHTGENSTSAAN